MKTAKKLTAILLTVIMLQSFSLAAYAADYTTNSRFAIISATEANTKYNNGDKFIFMFYNPSCVYCKNIGNNVVSVWMNTYGITVYGVNASGGGFPQFMVKDLGLSVSTPVIGFISGGSGTYYQGNTSATTLNNAFYSFYGITPTVSVTGVSISNSSASLTVGGTKQLSATVSPSNATNKSVTWTSSNTSVASVSSSGLVTAKAPGNATITVKTSDGGYTSSCSVTVSAATVSVTGVSISNSSASLTVGGTKQLSATVSPSSATNKSVTWTSSNTSVASVSSSGLVTAKAPGNATIMVKTNDGGYTSSCSVTVSAATVSVTGVSISNSSASLTVGGTKQLSATVSPSNATNKSVTWTSSNTSVASVSSSGLVTAKAPGNATITVKTSDGGYTSSCSVTVSAASNEAIEIRNPSTTTISYGDSIILHADINGTLPAGARIEWTASNGNFDMSVSADGTTCKISPKSSGKTVFTATVYDQNGNVISSDTQEMTAKAGLFDKIVAFFKKIFGMTETIPEAFKSIF